MLKESTLKRRWKLYTFLAAIIVAVIVMFASGFALDIGTATLTRLAPEGFGLGAPTEYFGPASLEERIASSDVIGRVKLRSATQTVEPFLEYDGSKYYIGAVEFTFDVLEYLKGSGGSQLVGIAEDFDIPYNTKLAASTIRKDLLSGRDKRWDDREAIVFLNKRHIVQSVKPTDRYWLGSLRFSGSDRYSIASWHRQVWLPSASAPEVDSQGDAGVTVSTSSNVDRTFLLEVPESSQKLSKSCEPYCLKGSLSSTVGASSASASSSDDTSGTPSITLPGLKSRISEIQNEIEAGDGSEDYRLCVFYKYEKEREIRSRILQHRKYYYTRIDLGLASGSPSGVKVYAWPTAGELLAIYGVVAPNAYSEMDDWIGGKDASRFRGGYPASVYTVRPLPAGEYKFYYNSIPTQHAKCDGMPKKEKERFEFFVNVTAPIGVIHEAFFDPVNLTGGAIGADKDNGALKPTAFSVNGAATKIERIKWDPSGRVSMDLKPGVSLKGHLIEFIGLNGKPFLSLSFDRSAGTSGAQSWQVCDPPWKAGDLLMIRISAGATAFGEAAKVSPCPNAPTPTPTPKPPTRGRG